MVSHGVSPHLRNLMQTVPKKSLVRDAYERGREAAEYRWLRASPFYSERVLIGGKRIDITPLLDAFWYAGFDGEPYPDKSADPCSNVFGSEHAVDLAIDPLSQVERITAEHLAKGTEEDGAHE